LTKRAGQISLPHLGITKTEKIELKHKTDEQISLVNGLEPWNLSDRQKQTKVEDKDDWFVIGADRDWLVKTSTCCRIQCTCYCRTSSNSGMFCYC